MPDNIARGALEDFLSLLVPPGDPCWSHAEVATREARVCGAKLEETDHLKGALHAWLAWQAIPGQPFGSAITARAFRHDSAEALQFVAWFRELGGVGRFGVGAGGLCVAERQAIYDDLVRRLDAGGVSDAVRSFALAVAMKRLGLRGEAVAREVVRKL